MPLPELRHRCTNYDDLLTTSEFKKLDGPDRVAAYHALHYTATLKPLRGIAEEPPKVVNLST